jgi:hypothetical protein
MFSAHAPLLPGITLPLPDASNTPNSSDTATTFQGEEIDKYVHRYLSLSAYVGKKKKKDVLHITYLLQSPFHVADIHPQILYPLRT